MEGEIRKSCGRRAGYIARSEQTVSKAIVNKNNVRKLYLIMVSASRLGFRLKAIPFLRCARTYALRAYKYGNFLGYAVKRTGRGERELKTN